MFGMEVTMEPKKLICLSMKGGVGKTTTSISLAQALQLRGHKVGILDVDVHGSAMPRALHMPHDPHYEALVGGRLRPVMLDGFQVFSIGLLFPESMANMWNGEMKASAVEQIATSSIAWDESLDWIVVDTPPTSGDEVQSLLRHLQNIYGCVIITQPNDLSLLGITKTIDLLRDLQVPVCGLVTNMAGYRCPSCGAVSNPFDRQMEDFEQLAQEAGIRYLGSIPFATGNERLAPVLAILDQVLREKPTVLKVQSRKGGLKSWLIQKALR